MKLTITLSPILNLRTIACARRIGDDVAAADFSTIWVIRFQI